MEALSILKFWRNQTTVADVTPDALNAAAADEYETTDEDEDSFFDLVFEPAKNKYHFVESPRDVFLSKINSTKTDLTDINKHPNSSPVTTLRYPSLSKPKPFSLALKKSPKNSDDVASEQGKRFARDNSLRSKMLSEKSHESDHQTTSVSRYFRLIKPLVSKKGKVTEALSPFASPVSASASARKQPTQSGRVGSFKIINVGRSSWKGRSVFPSAAVDATVGGSAAPRRRDDSLLELNDGIQGAILHCKRSYSSSSSSSSQECSQLIRSASDPSHEKINAAGRFSCEEQRRCSI